MTEIEKLINEEYGVGIAVAPISCILWASEKCSDPKKSLKYANRVRLKHGMPLAYASYGRKSF